MTSSAVSITAGICSLSFCHIGGGSWLGGGRLTNRMQKVQRRDGSKVCSCFPPSAPHVDNMSLDRSEQRIFDYLDHHPEERHHWQAKVQLVWRDAADEHAAAA